MQGVMAIKDEEKWGYSSADRWSALGVVDVKSNYFLIILTMPMGHWRSGTYEEAQRARLYQKGRDDICVKTK